MQSCPPELGNLLTKCWNIDQPDQRPNFDQICDILSNAANGTTSRLWPDLDWRHQNGLGNSPINPSSNVYGATPITVQSPANPSSNVYGATPVIVQNAQKVPTNQPSNVYGATPVILQSIQTPSTANQPSNIYGATPVTLNTHSTHPSDSNKKNEAVPVVVIVSNDQILQQNTGAVSPDQDNRQSIAIKPLLPHELPAR